MIYLMDFKKETPPLARPCLPWPWQGLAAWAFLLGTLGIFPLNIAKSRYTAGNACWRLLQLCMTAGTEFPRSLRLQERCCCIGDCKVRVLINLGGLLGGQQRVAILTLWILGTCQKYHRFRYDTGMFHLIMVSDRVFVLHTLLRQ